MPRTAKHTASLAALEAPGRPRPRLVPPPRAGRDPSGDDVELGRRREHTARLALESELRAAQAIAREAQLARERAEQHAADADRRCVAHDRVFAASALFASVAHDIRSPLAALVLNLRTLEEELHRDRAVSAQLDALFDDTRLACDLIEGVLDSLRTYSTCSGTPRRVALRSVVDCTVRLCRWHIQRQGVRLSIVIDGEPDAWGTTSEICQILLNLLANAAEASPRGGHIVLSCRAQPGASILLVDDEGPGLTPAEAEDIFSPFRSSKAHGLGIGLTVARAMARKHGGDLRVVPTRLGGASFELRLPQSQR